MLKTSLRQLSTAFTIASLSILLGAFPGQSQRDNTDLSATLLDGADCVFYTSSVMAELYTDAAQVSINRIVYDRIFSMEASSSNHSSTLSCRVDSDRFSAVDLQMGVSDAAIRNGTSMTVSLYQGGNLRHTYANMQAGSMVEVLLDLNDQGISRHANSFAIEITNCNYSFGHCYLQFIEARLLPAPSITGIPPHIWTID